jgi:UDP-glucose 4-epimerase
MEGLARLVKQHAKSVSPIKFIPYDQAYEPGFEDMPRRVPSLEKLEQLTGFRPTAPLSEIIDRVVEHFGGNVNAKIVSPGSRISAAVAND